MIASKRSIAEEVVGAGEIPLTELSDHELKRLLALAPEAITDDREAEGMNSAEPVKQGSGALTS